VVAARGLDATSTRFEANAIAPTPGTNPPLIGRLPDGESFSSFSLQCPRA